MHSRGRGNLPKEDKDCGQEDAALPDGTPQGPNLCVQPLLQQVWLDEACCWQQPPCDIDLIFCCDLK